MNFQAGIVVNYNNQNYVIIEVINKRISEGTLTFLKIKNLINQEILIVDSNNVRQIDLNKKPTINNEQKGEDTSYIDSLFEKVGQQEQEDTLDSFDIFDEPTFTLDNLDFNNQEKSKKVENEHISHLVESFQTPQNTQVFAPRRKQNNNAINQTFTDLDKVSHKIEPNLFEQPVKKEETSVLELDQRIENNKEKENFNDQTLQFDSSNIDLFKEQSEQNLEVYEEPKEEINLKQNNIIQKDKKITNTIEYYETLENNITSNLEKDAINNIEMKANLAKEKHYNTLEIGPINTKRLLSELEKESQELKEENNVKKRENTNTIFSFSKDVSQDFLKKSNKYKKFKLATGILVLIFVLWLSIPIMAITTKIAYSAVTNNLSLKEVFTIYIFKQGYIVYTIADIFLLFVFPILTVIFLVYLVSYIISINVKQYKKIAYYNLEVKKKLEIIEDIQDYNNETSIYLIKVHNDIKKLKKDVKKIENQRLTANLDKDIENIKKISH